MSLKKVENDVGLEAYFKATFRSRDDIRRVYSARLRVGIPLKNPEDTFRIKNFDDWQKMLAQGERERVAIMMNPDKLPDLSTDEDEIESIENNQLQGAY